MVLMGVGVSLIVYGVGIHGAQKRKHRALFFYGATTLMSLVLSAIAVAFVAGFVLFGGASLRHAWAGPGRHGGHRHARDGGMMGDMSDHAHSRALDLMHKAGMIQQLEFPDQLGDGAAPQGGSGKLTPIEIMNVGFKHALQIQLLQFPNRDSDNAIPIVSDNAQPKQIDASVPIVDVKGKSDATTSDSSEQPEEIDASVPVVKHGKPQPQPIDASVPVVKHRGDKKPIQIEEEADEEQPYEVEYRVTPFGYAVLALGCVVGMLVLVLKIKSIRLAFQMRRMLLAMQHTSLPVRQPVTPPAAVQLATPPAGVQPPSGPAPTVRRDCSRCTYVNAVSATRCAMCDSPLAIVANAAPAPVPRIFVPGSLYPLNAPLN
jgi:hypothetical protein